MEITNEEREELRKFVMESIPELDESELEEDPVDETIYAKTGVMLKRVAKPALKSAAKKMRWNSKLKKLVPQI